LSKTKNIPPKAVIFSDFICTFAIPMMILLVLICSTKVSENLTWQNPEPLGFAASRVEELFVAQVLIKKVKLKCCGIKGI